MRAIRLSLPNLALAVPIVAIAMRLASAPTGGLSYLVLAGYALSGRAAAIRALTLSWLFSMINGGLAPIPSDGSTGRYAVQAAALVSVFLLQRSPATSRKRPRGILFLTLFIGGFIVVHSLAFSVYPDVSLLKTVSWLMVNMTLLKAWADLAEDERNLLVQQIFQLLLLLMLGSIPMILMSVGYRTNGTGFQGLLDHPQAFGAAMGMLGAWLGGRILSAPRPDWKDMAFFFGAVMMTFLSEARTGVLALFLGLLLGVLSVAFLSGRSLMSVAAGLRSKRVLAGAFLTLIVVSAGWSFLSERVDQFIAKRTDSTSIAEAYDESRGGLLELMQENIERAPFTGIGFGIGSIPEEMEIVRDPIFDLPVSALIEKGVLPVALWEELGFFGFILMMIWFFLIVRRSALAGLAPLALCLTALLENMGDSMFFSAGGMGLLQLILVSWCATATPAARRPR